MTMLIRELINNTKLYACFYIYIYALSAFTGTFYERQLLLQII